MKSKFVKRAMTSLFVDFEQGSSFVEFGSYNPDAALEPLIWF